MPLSPSSYFVPPSAIPFLVEDKYVRGGFRIVATIAERDAIHVAARKVGMRVLVADAQMIEYQLIGGTSNTFWQQTGGIATHQHAISDVTGLEDALTSKADSVHIHSLSSVTGLEDSLNAKIEQPVLEAGLSEKANAIHTHVVSDVTGLQAELDNRATLSELADGLAGKADSTHAHGIADVSGLQTALDGKASAGALSAGLAGKADSVHTHVIADVTGLQTSLDSKASSSDLTTGLAGKANVAHSHAIADVTGLQTALDGKANTAHSHTIANVTGLQTALDSKLDKSGGTIAGNLTITGDLVIQGNSVSISTTTLDVADPIVTLAKDNSGAAVPYAGLKVERGASDAFFVFDEADDRWTAYSSANDLSTAGTLADIEAGTFYGALSGNASTATLAASATKLATARTISLTGDATATGNFDGTGNLALTVTVADNSHAHTIANVTGLQTALDGKSDSAHTHPVVTTSADGLMSAADKVKLNGVATNANNYVHPTGDGNLHVPATGTTNNTKVLKAGATAGSAAWGTVAYSELSGVPSTFTPESHTHAIANVTGLQSALDGKLATGGTAANSSLLQGYATATGATANTVALRDSAGKLTAVDFTMTSDIRHKEVLGTIDDDIALEQVLHWETIYYRLNGQDRVMPGYSAQQMLEVTPDLVDVSDEDHLKVSYASSSPYLAAALRAVVKRLEALEK